MKKWFYRNVVIIYMLAMLLIIGGALYSVHSSVSVETFNALCSFAFVILYLVIVSSIFVGIWGENKLEETEKGEKV